MKKLVGGFVLFAVGLLVGRGVTLRAHNDDLEAAQAALDNAEKEISSAISATINSMERSMELLSQSKGLRRERDEKIATLMDLVDKISAKNPTEGIQSLKEELLRWSRGD